MKQWKQALQKTHGAWTVYILNDMCAPFSKPVSQLRVAQQEKRIKSVRDSKCSKDSSEQLSINQVLH